MAARLPRGPGVAPRRPAPADAAGRRPRSSTAIARVPAARSGRLLRRRWCATPRGAAPGFRRSGAGRRGSARRAGARRPACCTSSCPVPGSTGTTSAAGQRTAAGVRQRCPPPAPGVHSGVAVSVPVRRNPQGAGVRTGCAGLPTGPCAGGSARRFASPATSARPIRRSCSRGRRD
ncbi:hypothetical protein D3C81_1123880 [compost metagenome]